MKINCSSQPKGIKFSIEETSYNLEYPEQIWEEYPNDLKLVFLNNFAFLKALHLPQMLNKVDEQARLDFNTASPIFKEPIFNCMLNNIPFCADVDNVNTDAKIKNFMNLKFNFKEYTNELPKYEKKLEDKAALNISFGKDSLLTFGLADEIGLDPIPVFMQDNATKRENAYKMETIKKFTLETKKKVWICNNETGIIHDYRHWKVPRTEWGYGHLITELCFDIMPFANHHNAKYILFGNEQSCNDFYFNKEGYKSFPVFDQSSDWLIELSKMTRLMTNNQMHATSLIEPINELAITKILHNRYPNIGKFQMSCFPDENDYGKDHYWCEHCSKCARIFIFMKANGYEPSRIGFRTDMLTYEHMHMYSCFGINRNEGFAIGYDAGGTGRDEQLYAFYLAYKNDAKGDLIELFKKELLDEAKEREDELFKRFFGLHSAKTIPKKILGQVESIYREELSK